MKSIAYFLVYLITNSIIAQVVVSKEDIQIYNDSIVLPGTLKYTESKLPQPLVIFIQGSGDPDRNGNQPSYNVHADYINQLGDALSENEIAFYSYDKRNVSRENIKFLKEHYVFSDLAIDVSKVIDYFKDDSRFSSITLIGHSQGSLVGMLAINEHISKYVSLAGLGEPVDNAFVRQISNQNKELGEVARQHANELKETGDIKEINLYLVSLFGKGNHDFLIDYFKYDPSVEIKKIQIPTLIINGTKDSQVLVEDAKRLYEAQPNAEFKIVENMNHVLKDVIKEEDNMKSYNTPDYPLSETLVQILTEFIKR